MADFIQITDGIRNRKFSPVYVIDGEEPYFLDKLMALFENNVLTEAERDFNLSVLYGRDVKAVDVITSCRRFPMFAEKQVVLLKDAASMNDFAELSPYLEHPLPSTLLVI
jgi:DNA polymerase-3 subunit delta